MLKTVSLLLAISKYGYEALFAVGRFVETLHAFHLPGFGGLFEISNHTFGFYSFFPPPNHQCVVISEINPSIK